MKKPVSFAVLTAITLSLVGLGTRGISPAEATVLDGFAIDTQDKAVTVTLYTDQRAPYTTETQGKQFAIVLPNTELSKAQMENGLPVVLDNKNRFIGRAVPTADGKVKIILPNLSAEEYSVSVQQKRVGTPVNKAVTLAQAAPVAQPTLINRPTVTKTVTQTTKPVVTAAAPTLRTNPLTRSSAPAVVTKSLPTVMAGPVMVGKPRSAVNADSQFESVASNFPKPAQPTMVVQNTAQSPVVHLPPNTALRSNNGTIWNPYVVKTTPVAPAASVRVAANPRPNQVLSDVPMSTLSVAESGQLTASNAPPPGNRDPLWYLHALPPVDANQIPADNLQGAAANPAFIPALEAPPADMQGTPIVQVKSAFSDLKEAVQALPRWLLITMAIFLAGLGLFGLIGGLVLLRLLFVQARGGSNLQPAYAIYPAGMMPGTPEAPPQPASDAAKTGYATAPVRPLERLKFEDKVSVNAMDYLMDAPARVPDAVHNSVVLKFPGQRTNTQRRNSQRKVAP